MTDIPSAILTQGRRTHSRVTSKWGEQHQLDGGNLVTNGNIAATVTGEGVVVTRVSDGMELFRTLSLNITGTAQPEYYAWVLAVRSTADERVWGLGERMTSQLNNKGLSIDFRTDQANRVSTTMLTARLASMLSQDYTVYYFVRDF